MFPRLRPKSQQCSQERVYSWISSSTLPGWVASGHLLLSLSLAFPQDAGSGQVVGIGAGHGPPEVILRVKNWGKVHKNLKWWWSWKQRWGFWILGHLGAWSQTPQSLPLAFSEKKKERNTHQAIQFNLPLLSFLIPNCYQNQMGSLLAS